MPSALQKMVFGSRQKYDKKSRRLLNGYPLPSYGNTRDISLTYKISLCYLFNHTIFSNTHYEIQSSHFPRQPSRKVSKKLFRTQIAWQSACSSSRLSISKAKLRKAVIYRRNNTVCDRVLNEC